MVPDGKTFTINSQAVFTNNATMDLQGSATVTGYCGNPCGIVVNTGTIQKATGAAAATSKKGSSLTRGPSRSPPALLVDDAALQLATGAQSDGNRTPPSRRRIP